MGERKGMRYLREKLNMKRSRVELRYQYYEMKNSVQDFGISTPPDLRYWASSLGWCTKAVDALADRLQFRKFDDDILDMNDIYRLNNQDVLVDSAILGALIASCSFVYISPDETGYPRLQVIGAKNATGCIDPITNMLTEGYAVLERDEYGSVKREAYFTSECTYYYKDGIKTDTRTNPAPYPLLVPMIYRPDEERNFGHSRISRACMSIMGSALRTVKRSEISAEFYSYPQKYVTGLDPSAEKMDKWKATMSAMMAFTLGESGEKPTLGQFQQASMTPHLDQLRMFASLFAEETGMNLDDLGFPTENPAGADAIKASHENLRLAARKAQRTFGTGLLNVGYLAACVRDNYPYQRQQVYMTKPQWEPLFEPDAAMLSGIGDGAIKINQAVPGYFDKDTLRSLTGIDAG